MPIIEPFAANPFVDGRQSANALMVRSGIERYLGERNHVCLAEFTLKSGRRADIAALTPKGEFIIIEIKSSIEDFRADVKWPEYRAFCDYLYFATHAGVPADIFPAGAGLLIADAWGAEMLREAEAHKLNAPARKALTLRFARAAAARLQTLAGHAEKHGFAAPVEGDEGLVGSG